MALSSLMHLFQRQTVDPVISVNRMSVRDVMMAELPQSPGFVVQIGSFDGKTHDPIHDVLLQRDAWKAIFVEPVPYIFSRLQSNYPNGERFIFEQNVINNGKPTVFYHLDEDVLKENKGVPEWVLMLGSLNKSHIEKHLDGTLKPHIKSLDVSGMTLENLFNKHAVRNLHMLHIDAEGHDWKILKQLNLRKYSPKIILFEYVHLNPQEVHAAKRFLAPQYDFHLVDMDFLCVRKD